jgi:hypothetical protein
VELTVLFYRTYHGVHDSPADSIFDRGLLVARSCNEELVFDIDVMLYAADDLAIGILDRVLGKDTARPVGAGLHHLGTNGTAVVDSLRLQGRQQVELVAAHGIG